MCSPISCLPCSQPPTVCSWTLTRVVSASAPSVATMRASPTANPVTRPAPSTSATSGSRLCQSIARPEITRPRASNPLASNLTAPSTRTATAWLPLRMRISATSLGDAGSPDSQAASASAPARRVVSMRVVRGRWSVRERSCVPERTRLRRRGQHQPTLSFIGKTLLLWCRPAGCPARAHRGPGRDRGPARASSLPLRAGVGTRNAIGAMNLCHRPAGAQYICFRPRPRLGRTPWPTDNRPRLTR